MNVFQAETIVGSCRLCQVEYIAALSCCRTLAIVGRKTWERLHEGSRVGEVGTKLGAYCQIFYRINLSIHGREHLVLLVLDGVLAHVHDRVLGCSSPVLVRQRSQAAVFCIRTPVWQHESASRDWSHGGVATIVSLLGFLVGSHGVGAHLQPLARLHIGVGADVVTTEGRVLRNTVLIVETTRNVVVQTVGSTVDRELIALQGSAVVEHLVEPVHVHLRQEVVVLAGIQSHFFLKLYALGSVHHLPVVLSQLRETILSTQCYLRLVHGKTTLRCDHDHTIGSTCTVDRSRRSIL